MLLAEPQTVAGSRRDMPSTLYAHIHAQRQTTRIRLARALQLSKATVSGGVTTLLDQGLVREVGKHQPGSGRGPRQMLLEVEPRARLVLGAQIGDAACTVVTTDVYARIEDRVSVPVRGLAPADAIDAVVAGVALLRRNASAPILGLGVGAPGIVDANGRRVTVSVGHHWSDVALADRLEAALDLPVRVANRAKVAALGEYWARAGSGTDSLVYVQIGTGIVAGLVVDGSLLSGRNGIAGELGHTTVLPDGPPCDCGNRGCLQTLASISSILREVRTRAQSPQTLALVQRINRGNESDGLEQVVAAARDGDHLAQTVLDEAATYLGIAIANLINLFNPQIVVLGGPMSRTSDGLLASIVREIQRRALREALANLSIVGSAMPGEEAGAIGGASLFLERLPDYLAISDTARSATALAATA